MDAWRANKERPRQPGQKRVRMQEANSSPVHSAVRIQATDRSSFNNRAPTAMLSPSRLSWTGVSLAHVVGKAIGSACATRLSR